MREHLKPILWTLGGIAFLALLLIPPLYASRMNREQAAQQASEEKAMEAFMQEACGKDVVFSYDRFGALSTPVCWKVICVNVAENITRERIRCEEQDVR